MLTSDVDHAGSSAEGVAGRQWAWSNAGGRGASRHVASSSVSSLREADLEGSERCKEGKK